MPPNVYSAREQKPELTVEDLLKITKRPTTYTTYRMFRSDTTLPNGKHILDKLGAMTACCVIDTVTKKMNVGFSFLNPNDRQILNKGRAKALGRCQQKPIVIRVQKRGGKFLVAESVLKYIVKAATKKHPEDAFGIPRYNGKPEKCMFRKWFYNFIVNLNQQLSV